MCSASANQTPVKKSRIVIFKKKHIKTRLCVNNSTQTQFCNQELSTQTTREIKKIRATSICSLNCRINSSLMLLKVQNCKQFKGMNFKVIFNNFADLKYPKG